MEEGKKEREQEEEGEEEKSTTSIKSVKSVNCGFVSPHECEYECECGPRYRHGHGQGQGYESSPGVYEYEDSYYLLDVDVVNTSNVMSNVHELRHSFFYLSREMIEDVRELMISGQRAEFRQARLRKRDEAGNVFDVCVAPANFKSF